MNKYDLIIQNSASKENFLYSGLTDNSGSHLYFQFTNLDLDVPDGEYTYCLLRNDRDDVVYDFTTPILDSMVHADGKDVMLRDLQPITGLLRVGDAIQNKNTYDNNNKKTIFYYD